MADETLNHEDDSEPTKAKRVERHGSVECYHKRTRFGVRHYWRAKSSNGNIVADSGEGYNSEAARDEGLDLARRALTNGQRVDLP